MAVWKHVALLVGVLGVTGVFAPLLEVKQGRVAIELSARRLSFGADREYALVERELPKLAENLLPGSLRSTRDDIREVAHAARWAALAYLPAAALALLGLLGIRRRRFGRGAGLLAVLCGLASFGAWLALHHGIRAALPEAEVKHMEISLLFGAHLLLLVGAAGVVAGRGAVARPDLGPPARSAQPPAYPPPPGPPGPPLGPPGPPPPGFPPPPIPPPNMMPPPASA